jgi:hypothetical protein
MITIQINGVIYQTVLEAVDVNVGGEWTSETIPVLQRADAEAVMHNTGVYDMVADQISYAYIDALETHGTFGYREENEFAYQMLLNDRPATHAEIRAAIYY